MRAQGGEDSRSNACAPFAGIGALRLPYLGQTMRAHPVAGDGLPRAAFGCAHSREKMARVCNLCATRVCLGTGRVLIRAAAAAAMPAGMLAAVVPRQGDSWDALLVFTLARNHCSRSSVNPVHHRAAPAAGAENRLEIELESGETVRLVGQGAGRWATTLTVLGDVQEVVRRRSRAAPR